MSGKKMVLALAIKIIVMVLRFLRDLIDYATEKVFSYFYNGKQEQLPLIKDSILLQPAMIIAAKIRRGELKSVDLVKAYIRRIRDVQPIVNAIVDERFVEAIEEASMVDQLIASETESEGRLEVEKPLLGVPVTVKEAIAVKGCLFTVGLVARRGVRAETDSDVVSLLKKAGAIPIAITITPELCFWWESYNVLYGRCRNPYDTTRTVGGSSGGEGCIVGCAGSVIGIANDVGGSIRIPACFNGVFGHKPSRGVVSNQGQYPPASPILQTYLMTGPICRYSQDLLPLMKILTRDKKSLLKLEEPVNISKIKIYYMENDGGNPLISAVNPEIVKAMRKVLKYFETTYGIIAREVNLSNMKDSFEIWANILTTSDMQPVTVEMTGRKGNANLFGECLKWLAGISDHILPVVCQAGLTKIMALRDEKRSAPYYQMVSDLQQEFEDMLLKDGIFLYPTNPDLPPYHGQPLLKPMSVGYTAIFNLLGLPISQCPLGLSKNGLPLGIQVVGSLYNDRLTIAIANELEKAFGGWFSPSAVSTSET